MSPRPPRTFLRAALTLSMLTCGLYGCDEDSRADDYAEPSDESAEFRPNWGCPMWRCGMNAATIFGLDVTELSNNGEPNASQISIEAFRDSEHTLHDLHLENDEFVAYTAQQVRLSGEQLIGFEIVLENESDLRIRIMDTGFEDSWAVGAAPVRTYALAYYDGQDNSYKNVCFENADSPDATVATIITGERYDLENTLVAPEASGWFTIACAGSALAKLKLMNYSPNANFDGEGNPSTPQQRQAGLRMLTADYCGDGTSFTVDGTPLLWQNQSATVEYNSSWLAEGEDSELEAVWDDKGAVCLNTPRLFERAEIMEACPLPECTGEEVGEWTTWSITALEEG